MRTTIRKILLATAVCTAVLGLASSGALAATQQASVNGPALPQTVPAGYSLYFTGVSNPTSGVTSVCTTFNVSGSGTVYVYFHGEPQGKTYTAPGTHTYCSSNPNVLYYAANGREVPVFTVTSGVVTFNSVTISVNTAGSTG